MEFLDSLRSLGLTEWLFSLLVAIIILHYVGLLKPVVDGVKGLFNRTYASEQQTLVMNDKLLNFIVKKADDSEEIQSKLNEVLNLLKYIANEDTRRKEIESDIDIILHEIDQKVASSIRTSLQNTRTIERLSRLITEDQDQN